MKRRDRGRASRARPRSPTTTCPELARLRFRFDRHAFARLRLLIDRLNTPVVGQSRLRRARDRLGDGAARLVEPLLVAGRRPRPRRCRDRGRVPEAVVREVAELFLDRGEPFGDAFVVIVRVIECLREQIGGMADVEPGRAQVHHAARVGGRRRPRPVHRRRPAAAAATLRSRISPRSSGCSAA